MISKLINRSLILNHHSTQCHWPHTLYRMGLVWLILQAEPLPYKLFLLLSQTNNKNYLLFYTTNYIHHLQTYLFFINTIQLCQKCSYEKSFKSIQNKNLLQATPKNLSLGIIQCTLKKNILNRLLTNLTIRTLLWPTPISHAYPTPQKPHGYPNEIFRTT